MLNAEQPTELLIDFDNTTTSILPVLAEHYYPGIILDTENCKKGILRDIILLGKETFPLTSAETAKYDNMIQRLFTGSYYNDQKALMYLLADLTDTWRRKTRDLPDDHVPGKYLILTGLARAVSQASGFLFILEFVSLFEKIERELETVPSMGIEELNIAREGVLASFDRFKETYYFDPLTDFTFNTDMIAAVISCVECLDAAEKIFKKDTRLSVKLSPLIAKVTGLLIFIPTLPLVITSKYYRSAYKDTFFNHQVKRTKEGEVNKLLHDVKLKVVHPHVTPSFLKGS